MPPPTDPSEPIGEHETLLRRVSAEHVLDGSVQDPAMKPSAANDANGLSLYREAFHSVEDVAVRFRGPLGVKPAFVARLNAGDLIRLGLVIVPEPRLGDATSTPPRPDRSGHCVIQNFAAVDRDTPRGMQLRRDLAKLAGNPLGPFAPPAPVARADGPAAAE